MKKVILSASLILASLTVFSAGCGSDSPAPNPTPTQTNAQKIIGTWSDGSFSYIFHNNGEFVHQGGFGSSNYGGNYTIVGDVLTTNYEYEHFFGISQVTNKFKIISLTPTVLKLNQTEMTEDGNTTQFNTPNDIEVYNKQ
jgi:hypothetical protein